MTFGIMPIALVGYIVSIVLVTISTVYRSTSARRAASVLFVLTWVAHLAAVVREAIAMGGVPLSNLAQYLLVFSWAVLTVHLYLWFHLKVYVAGLVLPPLAAIAAFASMQLMPPQAGRMASQPDALFLAHTTVATIGMAILGISFAMSVLYLVQDRALKRKRTLGLLQRLPSLEQCDQVGYRSLVVGFVLLTLGIASGIAINTAIHHRVWVWGAKGTFPVLAWIVFATILVARTSLGFRGRKSAYLTITGFALGILTVIGMTL
jgi:ABC-type uncharacterized transport system permease subunit